MYLHTLTRISTRSNFKRSTTNMNSSRLVIIPRLKCQYALLFTDSWKKNRWFHAFLKDIRRWPGLSTG